jgi:hypothetical protein
MALGLAASDAGAQCSARDWLAPFRAAQQTAQLDQGELKSSLERFQQEWVYASLEMAGSRKEMLAIPGRGRLYRGVTQADVSGNVIPDFVDFGNQFGLPLQALAHTFPEGPCSLRGATPSHGAISGTVEADAGRLRYDLRFMRQNTTGGAESLAMKGEFRYDGAQRAARDAVAPSGWMQIQGGRLVPVADEEFEQWSAAR